MHHAEKLKIYDEAELARRKAEHLSLALCRRCRCVQYPDCVTWDEAGDFEFCDNCVCGASGCHKKLDEDGLGHVDVLEGDANSDAESELGFGDDADG